MKRPMKHLGLGLVLALVACGGDGGSGDGGGDPDASIDGDLLIDAAVDAPPSGAFALTSPMLAAGAMFDAANTCNGANTSPQLVWSNPPANTAGFAVVLTDKSNDLVHWVIYDIPAAATGLPANVEKLYAPANVAGAHQTTSYQATTRGYLGPCPPVVHTYEFMVYALDVATLPGTTMMTTRAQAVTAILQHDLGMASLSGTYMQP